MTDVALDNANAGTSVPAATGSSPAAPASTPQAVSAPTSGGVPDAAPSEPVGPIPLDRHKSILEHTRAETRQEYEGKYGWIGDRTREQVEEMERWYRWFDADPVAAVEYFQSRLQAIPEYAARLRPRQAPQAPQAPQELMPDGQMPDGTPVFTRTNVERFIKQMLNQEIGPIKQTFAQQQIEQQTAAQVSAEVADARANWMHFTELEPEIKRIMQQDRRSTLYSAHQRALKAYMDQHDQQTRSTVVSDLAKKATASTVSPTAAPVLTPVDRDKLSFVDALKAAAAK